QFQIIVDLRHGADGRARALDWVRLFDCDRRRDTADVVYARLVHAVEKLPHIGAECFDVTSLAFGVNRLECQTRFAAAAGTCDDRQFPQRKIDIDSFEIVLAGPANLNVILRAWRCDPLVLRNLRTHWKYSLPVKRFANFPGRAGPPPAVSLASRNTGWFFLEAPKREGGGAALPTDYVLYSLNPPTSCSRCFCNSSGTTPPSESKKVLCSASSFCHSS